MKITHNWNISKSAVRKTLSRKNSLLLFLLLGGWILLTPLSAFSEPKLWHVHSQAPSGGDGLSWETAFNDLSQALHAASEDASEDHEIWIAQGSYTPSERTDPPDPRTATFTIPGGLSLYGGFQGKEDLLSQRNWQKYPTILTGDLQGDNDSANNSYHVITLDLNRRKRSLLDGFIITGGNANGTGIYCNGGGIFASGSSLVLRNSILRGNQADQKGGGLYNYANKEMQLQGVSFLENRALNGGAIYSLSSVLEAEQCTFAENDARGNGGAMVCEATPGSITNCTFYGNTAPTGWGGGIHSLTFSALEVVHATFTRNKAQQGGALSTGGKSLVMLNSIAWGNEATSSESQIYAFPGSLLTISHSLVQGGFEGGTEILDLDPELQAFGDQGGETYTCALLEGSPARKRGLEPGEHLVGGKILVVPSEDQRGVPRPQGTGNDLGAYEFLPPTPTVAPTSTPIPTPTKAPTSTPVPTPTVAPATPTLAPTSIPTVTPMATPTPLPAISPTVAPSPSPVLSPFPSGIPLQLPALTVGALQGDLSPGVTIFPEENNFDPEVQKLEEDLRNPQSPLRQAIEFFLRGENPKRGAVSKKREGLSSERVFPPPWGPFESLGAFRFREISLACLSSRGITVPLTIFCETAKDGEEPLFFALLKTSGEDPLSGKSYLPISLGEFREGSESEDSPGERHLKIFSCGLTLEDQKEHDTDPRPCFMSGAFVVLHAGSEGEPLSGGSSGGCSGGYLPGMLLLGLPWFLLKP